MHSDGKRVEELEQSRGRRNRVLFLAAVPSMVLRPPEPCSQRTAVIKSTCLSAKGDPLGLIVVPILDLLVTLGEVPSLCESVLICKIDIRCRLCGFFIEISKGKTCM